MYAFYNCYIPGMTLKGLFFFLPQHDQTYYLSVQTLMQSIYTLTQAETVLMQTG